MSATPSRRGTRSSAKQARAASEVQPPSSSLHSLSALPANNDMGPDDDDSHHSNFADSGSDSDVHEPGNNFDANSDDPNDNKKGDADDDPDDIPTQPSAATTLCVIPMCGFSASSLSVLASHLNSTHSSDMGRTEPRTLRKSLSKVHLDVCPNCRCAKLPGASSGHDCLHADRVACPVHACATTHGSAKLLITHLSAAHHDMQFLPRPLKNLGIRQCSDCLKFLSARTGTASHKCKGRAARPGSNNSSSSSSSSSSSNNDSSTAQRPPGPRLIPPSRPPVVNPVHAWTHGEPESAPNRFSWLFVPLIRCALDLDAHGGMAEASAGLLWKELRDAYAAEFKKVGLVATSLPWQMGGYLDASEQVRLLRGHQAGGQSNISDAIEGKLEQFALRMQRVFQARQAPLSADDGKHSRPPHSPPSNSSSSSSGLGRAPPPRPALSSALPGDDAPDPGAAPRLTVADIAEHARLWQFIPHGCEDHWRNANRARWQALLNAHAAGNVRERGHALDAILVLPSQCLVRTRGGVRRTRTAIRTRLNTVAAARSPLVQGRIPARSGTPHTYSGTVRRFTELDVWKARVRRAVERGKAGNTKRCVEVLTQDGLAAWTDDRINAIRRKHPPASHAAPETPTNAPFNIVDLASLAKLITKMATFTAAGPSGWTAELLLALLDDKVCMNGITLLVQLIANNDLDQHSRDLLTCSLLHAIPKSNGDLRPLALGEFFVKAACKYCFDLDAGSFPDIFEPIQLAVCSPGGSERAILTMQAKTELDPDGYITIYVDSVNAYNSASRAMMLESVYSDPRLAHLWRAYDFCYSSSSQLLLRQSGTIIDTVAFDQGGAPRLRARWPRLRSPVPAGL